MVWCAICSEHGDGLFNTALRSELILHEGTGAKKCEYGGDIQIYYPLCYPAMHRFDYMHDLSSNLYISTQSDIRKIDATGEINLLYYSYKRIK